MLKHYKSLIYRKLRGGVKTQPTSLKNDLRVVSVTSCYSIHSSKASATVPLGSVEDALLNFKS